MYVCMCMCVCVCVCVWCMCLCMCVNVYCGYDVCVYVCVRDVHVHVWEVEGNMSRCTF